MNDFKSTVVFRYYNDFDKAIQFYEEILGLTLTMDQGWARVYKVTDGSFLGVVKRNESSIELHQQDNSLISFNVNDCDSHYKKIKTYNLPHITEVKVIESIPLKSFFFKDFEGYDYEIQEFLNEEDKQQFGVV